MYQRPLGGRAAERCLPGARLFGRRCMAQVLAEVASGREGPL